MAGPVASKAIRLRKGSCEFDSLAFLHFNKGVCSIPLNNNTSGDLNMLTKKDRVFAKAWSKKIRAIQELGGGCCYCGNKDIFVLEFHHNMNEKECALAKMFNNEMRWEEIKIELKKCKVVCGNCHFALHHKVGRAFELKKKILETIKKRKCCYCGFEPKDNKGLSILCFHHPKENKEFNVSDAISRRVPASVDMILDEINKCEMLCRNCHLKIHRDVDRFYRLEKVILDMSKEMRTVPPKVNRERMKALKNEGMGVCEIAKSLNCAKSTVSMALASM